MLYKANQILIVGIGLLCLILIHGCSKDSAPDKVRKKDFLDRINRGIEVTYDEISALEEIITHDRDYDYGIETFEKLKGLKQYDPGVYKIYNLLAKFYALRASKAPDQQERKNLINKADEYANYAFNKTPAKHLSYFNRAKIYALMLCTNKANQDILEVIETAQSQDILLWDDGVYFDRNKFIKTVRASADLFPINDDCMIN